jgi:hypothetical protein
LASAVAEELKKRGRNRPWLVVVGGGGGDRTAFLAVAAAKVVELLPLPTSRRRLGQHRIDESMFVACW